MIKKAYCIQKYTFSAEIPVRHWSPVEKYRLLNAAASAAN